MIKYCLFETLTWDTINSNVCNQWSVTAYTGAIWPSLSPCTLINPILLTYLLFLIRQWPCLQVHWVHGFPIFFSQPSSWLTLLPETVPRCSYQLQTLKSWACSVVVSWDDSFHPVLVDSPGTHKCPQQVSGSSLLHTAPPVASLGVWFLAKWQKASSCCAYNAATPNSALSGKLYGGLSSTPSYVTGCGNQIKWVVYPNTLDVYAIQLPVKAAAKCMLTFLDPEYSVDFHLCHLCHQVHHFPSPVPPHPQLFGCGTLPNSSSDCCVRWRTWHGSGVVWGLLAWCPWGWHQLEVTPMGIRRSR